MKIRVASVLLLFLVGSYSNLAVAARVPAGDPKAVALASQSIAALIGKIAVSDVTLTGTVEWNGKDTGSGVLKALGTEESRIDLTLSDGTGSEVRDVQTGFPRGQSTSPDRAAKASSSQNCQTDAVWFFPALTSLGGKDSRLLKYIGQETRNDVTVEHIRSYAFDGKLPAENVARLEAVTAVDFYLDSATLLPVALSFSIHPDDDASTDLLTEVEFSNYQQINGVLVPTRIRRYVQGDLSLDVTVSNVILNAGLDNTIFAVNSQTAEK